MGFLLSVVLWLLVLGIGGAIGYAVGGGIGAIVGVLAAQILMATIIPGPKYPGDTNYWCVPILPVFQLASCFSTVWGVINDRELKGEGKGSALDKGQK